MIVTAIRVVTTIILKVLLHMNVMSVRSVSMETSGLRCRAPLLQNLKFGVLCLCNPESDVHLTIGSSPNAYQAQSTLQDLEISFIHKFEC